ncbi:replication initiation factor domain-containing protein [Lactococcus lactis]|uniref:replication initiation factor domain-containing protein n=1 Tax=Lactococcus lactis TaxID=1358 RepID=UPI002378C5FF|nr:replication initiation factor domain-containing protein [Lactococcus lactis]WDA68718.1 replication initiation factor domain-containing protein [Lactococcus lactis]
MARTIELSTMTAKDLKKLRKNLGYTLRDFASKVGINFETISRYEKGKRSISIRSENQIKQALGLVLEKKHDYELHVHLDFLRLTFFDTTPEIIMKHVLGIEKEYFFYEVNQRHGFDGIYSCGRIQLYVSEKVEQGLMLELTGQGLLEMETVLQEADKDFTLNDWLVMITDSDYYLKNGYFSRFNCSRLDIAIDEMYKAAGNYDLHDLKWRKDSDGEKLIDTKLRSSQDIESFWHDKPLGLTLYFGSPQGNFLLRMYEKAMERAKKENRELEDVLNDYGVVNRYEMQIRAEYAEAAFNELATGKSLDQFAINLLLSKIAVYEAIETESGKIAYQFHQPFYDVFGKYQAVKINGKTNETDVEKSMKWIISQVSRTLALLKEVYGKQWLFEWLDHLISEVEFTDKQQKVILFEKARVQNQENGMYLWYRKKILEKKYNPENVYVKIENPDNKFWVIRLKNIPLKFQVIYVNSSGEYTVSQPNGMTLEQINDLGEKKGIDFINSPLFVVYEVVK